MRFLLVFALMLTLTCVPNDRDLQIGQHQGSFAKVVATTVVVRVLTPSGSGHGSGVIVGWRNGLYRVLTARHVASAYLDELPRAMIYIEVPLLDSRFPAQVLRLDSTRDLALLTFRLSRGLPIAEVALMAPLLGDQLYHYGFPGSQSYGELTQGILSAKVGPETHWATTIPVWYGCSGGGVWNASGRLVGLSVQVRWFQLRGGSRVSWGSFMVRFEGIRSFLGIRGQLIERRLLVAPIRGPFAI